VDGDGDLDVVGVTMLPGEVFWHKNHDGAGNFGSSQSIAQLNVWDVAMVAGDIDGDQDQDILLAYGSVQNNAIGWYESLGWAGNLAAPAFIVNGTWANPTYPLLTDIEGDGDLDVVVAVQYDDSILWYENTDGQGTFSSARYVSNAVDYPGPLAASDLDGDGDQEVLAILEDPPTGPTTAVYFENVDGLGTFGVAQSIDDGDWMGSIRTADLDGDNDQDVLIASSLSSTGPGVRWYENANGLGAFGTPLLVTLDASGAATAVDIDGDGHLDVLASGEGYNEIIWCRNTNGLGSFGPSRLIVADVADPKSVRGVDLDGDGDQDVLAESNGNPGTVWFENLDGPGDFSAPQIIAPLMNQPGDVADLDGDGDLDVIGVRYDPGSSNPTDVAWYENLDGQGTFGPARTIANPTSSVSLAVAADLDGDGDLDVIVPSGGLSLYWYENLDGLGTFGSFRVVAYTSRPRVVLAADLDGDGDQDIACGSGGSAGDRTIRWFKNVDGAGTFALEQIVRTQVYGVESIHAADLSGDGVLDLIAGLSITGKIEWYRNNGTGFFLSPQVITYAVDGVQSVHCEDLDADGDLDVMAASYGTSGSSGMVTWYENLDGAGTFGSQSTISSYSRAWNGIHGADINGDGAVDVLACSGPDDGIVWYRNLVHDATASYRNAGANPASYATNLPILGQELVGIVDLRGTPDHPFAMLFCFAGPLSWTDSLGRVVLTDINHPWGELFNLPLQSDLFSVFRFPIPNYAVLIGFECSAQAVHFGGVTPWIASNAQDFRLGR